MKPDPVVEEVRAAREAYAASFNYDLAAMVADLRRRQAQEGRRVVSRPPKPPRPTHVTTRR